MSDITDEETKRLLAETTLVAAFGVLIIVLLIGVGIGRWTADSDACPEPQYDVNRVVKMHEEQRKCEAELEEARDNVLVCGRLLKRALE